MQRLGVAIEKQEHASAADTGGVDLKSIDAVIDKKAAKARAKEAARLAKAKAAEESYESAPRGKLDLSDPQVQEAIDAAVEANT